MKIKTIICAVCTCLAIVSFNASATIINIDAINNNTLNPVSIFFDAGTHVLNPIGISNGGDYDALSAHRGINNTWLWRYSILSSEIGVIDVNFSHPFSETEMDAFATAVSTSFTLTSGDFVNFYIHDGPNGHEWSADNVGGISLSSVPIPPAVWLLGSGLIYLAGLARRKANA